MRRLMNKFIAMSVAVSISAATIPLNLRADTDSYRLKQESSGLGYVNSIIGESSLAGDEVALSFNVTKDGNYRINYPIEVKESGKLKTYRIDVDLLKDRKMDSGVEVVELNSLLAKVSVTDESDKKVPLVYSRHKSPYTGDWDSTSKIDEYTVNLKVGDSDLFEDKALGLKVGNYAHLRIVYENGKVKFVTDGINKGNITEFKLYHDIVGITNITLPVSKVNIFKGLNSFKTSPTHLYMDGTDLKSLDVIPDKSVIPGSESGVSVRFEKPRKFTGKKFEYIDKTDGIKAVLKLSEEFKEGEDTDKDYQMLLNFDLDGGSDIKLGLPSDINSKVNGRLVETHDDGREYLTVYNSNKKINEDVVSWEYLDDGMIIASSVELIGGIMDNVKNSVYTPDNVGHTYVKYDAGRLGVDDIAFKVKQYRIDGSVTYKLQKSIDAYASDDKWTTLDTRHFDGYSGETLTLTTNNKTAAFYRIIMETDGKDENSKYIFRSQVIRYTPEGDIIPISPSAIESLDNVYVVPNLEVGQQPYAVGLDIKWKAPEPKQLDDLLSDNGKIYYELYLHDNKKEKNLIKVFEVSKGTDGVDIKPYAGTVNGEGSYDEKTNSFTMSKVAIKNPSEDAWERVLMPNDYLDKTNSKYPTLFDISVKNDLDYLVPGNYYLSIAIVNETKDNGLVVGGESKLKPLTIESIEEIIDTPNDISHSIAKVNDRVDANIEFNSIDLTEYVDKMLSPIGATLESEYSRKYEIYLYTNGNLTESDIFNGKHREIKLVDGKATIDNEYLNKENSVNMFEFESDRNSGAEEIGFIGLDNNQPYYVTIRVKIEPIDKSGNRIEPRYSLASKVYTFTTGTKPLPPNPDEQVPTVPKGFVVELDSETTSKVKWDIDKNIGDNTYYEVVRTNNKKLSEKDKHRELSLDDIIKDSGYKAFKTNEQYVKVYEDGVWNTSDKYWSKDNEFVDENLYPNNIYYYYIRTVSVINGKEVRSDWIHESVTTSPIGKPINLRVEDTDKHKYEPTNEVVVSLLAPIPKDADISKDYDIELDIREENGDFSNRYSYHIIEKDTNNQGDEYRYIVLKVTGLSHGKRYDIKARVVDKTQQIENGENPKSLYSNTVSHRTEHDAEEENKENKYEEYLKKYDSEVSKLRTKPYWKIDTGVYKYRKSYVGSIVFRGKECLLSSNEGTLSNTYYLPMDIIEEANKNKSTIRINTGNTTLDIRPDSINTKVSEIVEAYNNKKISDFYVGITLEEIDESVSDELGKSVGNQIDISIDIVEMEKTDKYIEDYIMKELDSLIATNRTKLASELDYIILDKGKIDTEELDDLIADYVDDVTESHEKSNYKLFNRYSNNGDTIEKLNKPMFIMTAQNTERLDAYIRDLSNWKKIDSYLVGGRNAIESLVGGRFILRKSLFSNVSNELASNNDFISKYGLTDIFSLSGNVSIQKTTKGEVYKSLARILGADRGIESTKYLIERGFRGITPNLADRYITNDEAIYLIMQAYEKLYSVDIKSIQVTNKKSVSNIGAFKEVYRPYVYGAVKLGVVKPTNNIVSVKSSVAVKEIINMMAKIVR